MKVQSKLFSAVKSGDSATTQVLIQAGADINARGKFGQTPLMAAISGEKTELALLLIKLGADLTVQQECGTSVLSLAAIWGNTSVVKAILEAGANPDICDGCPASEPSPQGYAPMMWAANRGFVEILELLITGKANVNLQNPYGETALMCTSETQAIEVLLAAGADRTIVDMNGLTAYQKALEQAEFQSGSPSADEWKNAAALLKP